MTGSDIPEYVDALFLVLPHTFSPPWGSPLTKIEE
jgi:hypothetical protein